MSRLEELFAKKDNGPEPAGFSRRTPESDPVPEDLMPPLGGGETPPKKRGRKKKNLMRVDVDQENVDIMLSMRTPEEIAAVPQKEMPKARKKKKAAKPDMVHRPPHYTNGSVECIDAIESALTPEEYRGFMKGQVIKYTWREGSKGGDQDLEKAAWYQARYAKYQRKKTNK